MHASRFPLILATVAFVALGSAHASTSTRFDLVPANAACLPNATGSVTVFHKDETLGTDTLRLDVSGLPGNTEFAVFLTQNDAFTSPPFGASSYIGDLTTNAAGQGTLKVDATIGEAFVSQRLGDPPARVRTDLDKVVLWFADPGQVPSCFQFSGSTPFDGDGKAGPAALSSHQTTGLEIFP